jgi:hypothetical protein
MRAEIRAGELLAEMQKNKGVVARDKKGQTRGSAGKPRVDEPPKLADLGITKGESQADAYNVDPAAYLPACRCWALKAYEHAPERRHCRPASGDGRDRRAHSRFWRNRRRARLGLLASGRTTIY